MWVSTFQNKEDDYSFYDTRSGIGGDIFNIPGPIQDLNFSRTETEGIQQTDGLA